VDEVKDGTMAFIPVATPCIGERELAYVTDALRSGWVSSAGPYVERFERAFAGYIGVSEAIAVANGTVGLHLALHALGLGPGDEVLVPALTFVATAHAVLQTGATPVFVDVEADTWCMDPLAAGRAITDKTRAILPVHLYGHPADMPALQRLAGSHGLRVIEDAAEAHGAEMDGRRAGSLGDAAAFSFYGNKIITTGEGGMVTTNNPELAERLRFLKDHGMSPTRRYFHSELAFNYRLTSLQAALGLAQLEQIEDFIAQRRQLFAWYSQYLPHGPLVLNTERPGTRNVYWMSSIVLTDECRIGRDELMAGLHSRGIDSRPFFIPMQQLPHLRAYRAVGRQGAGCPEAERLGARGLNLPSGPHVDEATVRYIGSVVKELLA
jgi:perosamine synthetase